MNLAKPAVRLEGRKLICEFDPPVSLTECYRQLYNAGVIKLREELDKSKGRLWPEF